MAVTAQVITLCRAARYSRAKVAIRKSIAHHNAYKTMPPVIKKLMALGAPGRAAMSALRVPVRYLKALNALLVLGVFWLVKV